MSRILLIAPAGKTGTVSTPSGREDIDANGFVEVDSQHLLTLLGAGFRLAPTSVSVPIGVNGIVETPLALTAARTPTGIALGASAAAGLFGHSITLGTASKLVGEAAQNNSKTSDALFEVVLPLNYVAGEDVAVVVNAAFSGSGTAGTKTIDANAYAVDADGDHSADLVSTAAQNIATDAADYAFVIDGEDLAPGSRLLIRVRSVLSETGNANPVTAAVNSVRLR